MSVQGTSITHFGSDPTSTTIASRELPAPSQEETPHGESDRAPAAEAESEALDGAQVIEMQAFSERKAWIEEKTRVRVHSVVLHVCLRHA